MSRKHAEDKSDHDYMADMNWLNELWKNPEIASRFKQHDSFCCLEFPNSVPLPIKRPLNFQHVGQVFDSADRPVMRHIVNFLHDASAPLQCRGNHTDWKYG